MYLVGQLRVPLATIPTHQAAIGDSSLDDAELIRRTVKRDDRDAFGVLVARHQSALRSFLRQLCRGNAAEADDLAQETFVTAYRNLDDFRSAASFKTWLFGIAHNQYRNLRRRQLTAAGAAADLRGDAEVEPSVRASDLQSDLAQSLRHLSDEERTAVHLHYHQGLSHQDISELMSWPLGTVKTHLTRAKATLRPLLEAWKARP